MDGHRFTELRLRICVTARALADTEDRLAGTLERMALTRPAEAARLRARASEARQFADSERRRADVYALEPELPRPMADGGATEVSPPASAG